MIKQFESTIADANDIHSYVGVVDKYLRPHTILWHRKVWEYIYIAKQFEYWAANRIGLTCLGFGCGNERLPFFLADRQEVDRVIASDAPEAMDVWTKDNQYLFGQQALEALAKDLKLETHLEKISYQAIDMNHFKGLEADFVWSASSLEHLGTMERAKQFIVNSAKCLRPGGLAVHATEYNLSSDIETTSYGDSVFFRHQDLTDLKGRCLKHGVELAPVNLKQWLHPYNSHIDEFPYRNEPSHIKVSFDGYVITSIGICLRRINA